ncbi:MAG: hypothetical protein ABSD96_20785 [Candidatus Korobacteraceae bacterium]
MKHHIALVLMFLAATFAVGHKLPLADAPEPFHLFLNDSVGITLAMNRDALPKSTPARELRCASSDRYGHTYCELLINDEVIIAGARVLSAEFMLDENRVTNIIFYLNTSHMGLMPLVVGLNKQFGEQSRPSNPHPLCWHNQVSSVTLFAGEDSPAVIMSLTPACLKYDEPLSKD